MLTNFATDIIPLTSEPIGKIFGFDFTNSMFYGLIIAFVMITFFMMAARRTARRPDSKLAFVFESIMEYVLGEAENNLGSRERALKFMPLFLTLFVFILFANLSGLVPGVESISVLVGGEHVSLLRSFTTDLNSTLAMALLVIITVQFHAFKTLGVKGHFQHYFTAQPWKPMNIFNGLIEVMGEFIKIITLSMRLFGVIYAGDVLIFVLGQIAGPFGWAAMVPAVLMELFFSLVQAYLFMMLSLVYLSIATHQEDHPTPSDYPADKPIIEAAGSN